MIWNEIRWLVKKLRLYDKSFINVTKALILALMLNVIFGLAFFLVEQDVQPNLTLEASFWWAMVTMTTVGYGDISPHTFVGRFFLAYPTMLIGIAVIGYVIGIVAETLVEVTSKRKQGLLDIHMRNHCLICNFPNEQKILKLIQELKCHHKWHAAKFAVITNNLDQLPEKFIKEEIEFINGDPADLENLERANFRQASGIFVFSEDPKHAHADEQVFALCSILTSAKKKYDLSFRLIVELQHHKSQAFMHNIDVDSVILPASFLTSLMAQEYYSPGMQHFILSLVSSLDDLLLNTVKTALTGQTLQQIQMHALQKLQGILVFGVLREEKFYTCLTFAGELLDGDKLVLLSKDSHSFEKAYNEYFNPQTA